MCKPSHLVLFCLLLAAGRLHAQPLPKMYTSFSSPRMGFGGAKIALGTDGTYYFYGVNCASVVFNKGKWTASKNRITFICADSIACIPHLSFTNSQSSTADTVTFQVTDCFGAVYNGTDLTVWMPTHSRDGDYYYTDTAGIVRVPKIDESYYIFRAEELGQLPFERHRISKQMPDTIHINIDYPTGTINRYSRVLPLKEFAFRIKTKNDKHRLYTQEGKLAYEEN